MAEISQNDQVIVIKFEKCFMDFVDINQIAEKKPSINFHNFFLFLLIYLIRTHTKISQFVYFILLKVCII